MKSSPLNRQSMRYALVTLASAVLSACAAGPSPSFSPQAVSPASHSSIDNMATSARGNRFATPAFGLAHSRLGPARRGKVEQDVFISDFSTSAYIMQNKTYKNLGLLQNGLTFSEGVWVDSKGNVYIANAGSNVVEYAKGGSSPKCTYTGTTDPINVTTDRKGNVYVADYNFFTDPGYIDEYAQCKNTIVKQWSIDKGPTGVAIDAAGDLFVAYDGPSNTSVGDFVEFKDGSSTQTPLGAQVGLPGGIVLDKNGNLITVDQVGGFYSSGSIDLIAPPYSSAVTLTGTQLFDPFRVSLSKDEKLLFCANAAEGGYYGGGYVTVYSYPSGSFLTELGSSDGVDAASGVAESPNAVF